MSEFLTISVDYGHDDQDLAAGSFRAGTFAGQADFLEVTLPSRGKIYLRLPDEYEPYDYRLRPYYDGQEAERLQENGGIWETVSELPAGTHRYYLEIVPEGTTEGDAIRVAGDYTFVIDGHNLVVTSPDGTVTRVPLPSGDEVASVIKRNVVSFISANESDDVTVRRNGVVEASGNQLEVEHSDVDGVFLASLKRGSVVIITSGDTVTSHRLTADAVELDNAGKTWSRYNISPDWEKPADGTSVGMAFLPVDSGGEGQVGPKGDKGDAGPRGAKGDKGDRGPAGAGLSAAQIASLTELLAFEIGLKTDAVLASASLRQAVSDAATRFPAVDGERPKLPPNRFDRELLVTVNGNDPHRFYVKDLENKNGVNTAGTQLTGANSISWQNASGDYYRISFLTGDRELVFAADNVGDYAVIVTDYQIDVEDFARISQSTAVPVDKLPLIPVDKLQLMELDKRWYKKTDRIPDSGLSRKAESFFGDATQGGWAFSSDMLVQSGVMPAAKPTLATAAAMAYVTNPDRGPRYTNVWDMIRVPKDASIDNARYVIGERDTGVTAFSNLASSTWEKLGTQGAYDYYAVQIADKPADADQFVENFAKFRIDGTKVEITGGVRVTTLNEGAGDGLTVTNSSGSQDSHGGVRYHD